MNIPKIGPSLGVVVTPPITPQTATQAPEKVAGLSGEGSVTQGATAARAAQASVTTPVQDLSAARATLISARVERATSHLTGVVSREKLELIQARLQQEIEQDPVLNSMLSRLMTEASSS